MHKLLFALTAMLVISITACKKGESAQETITTMEVHLTGGGLDQKFYWNDSDGDGGNAPTIDTITIPANVSFTGHLHLYDRSQTPEVDITDEVEAENTAHVFTYTLTNLGGKLAISNFDLDDDGKAFRLTSTWQTITSGTGTVRIVLYHEPTDKDNTTAPGGEVDFDVTFPVKVQ